MRDLYDDERNEMLCGEEWVSDFAISRTEVMLFVYPLLTILSSLNSFW